MLLYIKGTLNIVSVYADLKRMPDCDRWNHIRLKINIIRECERERKEKRGNTQPLPNDHAIPKIISNRMQYVTINGTLRNPKKYTYLLKNCMTMYHCLFENCSDSVKL